MLALLKVSFIAQVYERAMGTHYVCEEGTKWNPPKADILQEGVGSKMEFGDQR